MAINWRALEDLYTNEEDQDKILDQAIDIVRDTERYTDDNEHLRDRIEIHLSDILVSGSAQIELGNHFLMNLIGHNFRFLGYRIAKSKGHSKRLIRELC